MKEKLQRFMIGRYGTDNLNKFLFIMTLAELILSWVFGKFFYFMALITLIWSYFRMLSKDWNRRTEENRNYLKMKDTLFQWIAMIKDKEHRIYRCPECKQKIRVPRGKGKIAIRCPRCKKEFIKKS